MATKRTTKKRQPKSRLRKRRRPGLAYLMRMLLEPKETGPELRVVALKPAPSSGRVLVELLGYVLGGPDREFQAARVVEGSSYGKGDTLLLRRVLRENEIMVAGKKGYLVHVDDVVALVDLTQPA